MDHHLCNGGHNADIQHTDTCSTDGDELCDDDDADATFDRDADATSCDAKSVSPTPNIQVIQ